MARVRVQSVLALVFAAAKLALEVFGLKSWMAISRVRVSMLALNVRGTEFEALRVAIRCAWHKCYSVKVRGLRSKSLKGCSNATLFARSCAVASQHAASAGA